MSIKNKFYYYSNDGKIFTSKVKAVDHVIKTDAKLRFYYNDDVYSQVDWNTEPPLPLESYYIQQAQKLRDEYDYLVLFYSGGYDSTNILETFYYNNIKIDKIVIQASLSKDENSGSDDYHNGEIYKNSFPLIDKLGLANITQVVDQSVYFNNINNLSISKFNEEWPDHVGTWFSPHHWVWRDMERIVLPSKEYSKIGFIFGRDKPDCYTNSNGEFGFAFKDASIFSYINTPQQDNVDIINFYWDPNFTYILVKQLHILKNFTISTRLNPDIAKQINILPNARQVDSLVYNLKNPLTFKSSKSPSNILSKRDLFLYNGTSGSNILPFYYAGLKYINSHFNLNPNGIRPTYSRFYKI